MSGTHPEHGPFHHRALLYEDDEQFLAGTLPFLEAGQEAGDLMLVAVAPDKAALLRRELGDGAGAVGFADIRELGRNPARIIPAWQDLVDARDGHGVRGIGEPIWAGRAPEELVEAQRHEMLLNLAFADTPGFELLCPYDTRRLPAAVADEARRSHPAAGARSLDPRWDPFEGRLSAPPRRATGMRFGAGDLAALRALAERHAVGAGLGPERAGDLVMAVNELATNSVRHGGGSGLLRIWTEGEVLWSQVEDAGRIRDPLTGRRRPRAGQAGGFGLWAVHQLCDLVQIRSAPSVNVVRVAMRAG